MRYGSTRRRNDLPGTTDGARATSSSGTTVFPCIAVIASIRMSADSCIARRSEAACSAIDLVARTRAFGSDFGVRGDGFARLECRGYSIAKFARRRREIAVFPGAAAI